MVRGVSKGARHLAMREAGRIRRATERRVSRYRTNLSAYEERLRKYSTSKEEYETKLREHREKFKPYLREFRGKLTFRRDVAPRTRERIGSEYSQEQKQLQAQQKTLQQERTSLLTRRETLLQEAQGIKGSQVSFGKTITTTTTTPSGFTVGTATGKYFYGPGGKLVGVEDVLRQESRMAEPQDIAVSKLVIEPKLQTMQSIYEPGAEPEEFKPSALAVSVREQRTTGTPLMIKEFKEKPFVERVKGRVKQEYIQFRYGGPREKERISEKYVGRAAKGAQIAFLTTATGPASPFALGAIPLSGYGLTLGAGSYIIGKEIGEAAVGPKRRELVSEPYYRLSFPKKVEKALVSETATDIYAGVGTSATLYAGQFASIPKVEELTISGAAVREVRPGVAEATGFAKVSRYYPITGQRVITKHPVQFASRDLMRQAGGKGLVKREMEFLYPKKLGGLRTARAEAYSVVEPVKGTKDFYLVRTFSRGYKPTKQDLFLPKYPKYRYHVEKDIVKQEAKILMPGKPGETIEQTYFRTIGGARQLKYYPTRDLIGTKGPFKFKLGEQIYERTISTGKDTGFKIIKTGTKQLVQQPKQQIPSLVSPKTIEQGLKTFSKQIVTPPKTFGGPSVAPTTLTQRVVTRQRQPVLAPPKVKTKTAQVLRTRQKLATKVRQKQRTRQLQRTTTAQATAVRQTLRQRLGQRTLQRQTTRTRQAQRTLQRQATQFQYSITSPLVPPPPPGGFPPLIVLGLPSLRRKRKRARAPRLPYFRPFAYTPSLIGLDLPPVRMKVPKKLTGLEVRRKII